MNLICSILQIYEFYQQHPEHKGCLYVNTPYGMKRVVDAHLIEKSADCYIIKTDDHCLICSPDHRVYTTKWVHVKNVDVGDCIQTDLGVKKVVCCEPLSKKYDLYDITVDVVEQYYSNGILSHNSSILETIPFALFGKLSRPVNKSGIINWKNGKQCEVKLTFRKNNATYTILRALKPDKFEIYKDGSLIPIPSNVKMYQEILENDVIGFDYSTFMYLFYTNLNSNIPILKMNTSQKRSFLERMFLLDTYSELTNKLNKKLSSIEEKLFKDNVNKEQKEKLIGELESQNNSLKLKLYDITPYELELIKEKELLECKKKEVVQDNIDDIKKKICYFEEKCSDNKEKLNNIISSIRLLESDNISKTNYIQDIEKRKNDRDCKLQIIQKQLDELSVDTELYNKVVSNISKLEESVKLSNDDKAEIYKNISVYNERKKNLEETYNALRSGICPTCNSEFSSEQLNEKYVNEINTLETKINDFNITYDKLKFDIIEQNSKISKFKGKVDEFEAKQRKIDKLKIELDVLKGIEIPTCDTEKTLILENNNKIKSFTLELENIRISMLEDDKQLLAYNQQYTVANDNITLLQKISDNIRHLEEELVIRRTNRIEIEKIIQDNIDKGNSLQNDILVIEKSFIKINDLKDYLTYLKILCKDENVKQYAISSYMKYLMQQTNFYLSQSGSTHYVKFNKWLEEEIHGSGVFNATYGNLSGGEARCIDLAVQFAFLDVAKLKTGVLHDVLLLDELLDSSLDSSGLTNILRIVKTKQYEDKSKVFIITHRTEIADIEADNIYLVSKNKNGFSVIEKQ